MKAVRARRRRYWKVYMSLISLHFYCFSLLEVARKRPAFYVRYFQFYLAWIRQVLLALVLHRGGIVDIKVGRPTEHAALEVSENTGRAEWTVSFGPRSMEVTESTYIVGLC